MSKHKKKSSPANDYWGTQWDQDWHQPSMHYYSSCTHNGGETPLLSIDGRHFHPVNTAGAKHITGCAVHIDLAGIFPRALATFIDQEETTLALPASLTTAGTDGPKVLRLNWPDYGVPPDTCGVQFWRTLIGSLPTGKIAVGCMGSHGRTGTFLALLRILFHGDSAPNAINWVRVHHCPKAVESVMQETYLWRLARTAKTDTQPYDDALAAQVAPKTTTALTSTAPTKGPQTYRYPNLNLVEVQYLNKEGTLVCVTAADWQAPTYWQQTYTPTRANENRINIYQ